MAYREVENIHRTAGLLRACRIGEIGFSILAYLNSDYRVFQSELTKINLLVQHGEDLQLDRQAVGTEQGMSWIGLGAVNDDAKYIGSEPGKLEIVVLDFNSAARGFGSLARDRCQNVTMESRRL